VPAFFDYVQAANLRHRPIVHVNVSQSELSIVVVAGNINSASVLIIITRSQAVARIADRTAKNCRVTWPT